MLALPNGVASRRSHLESVTYRTLVQLLALNLDGSQNPDSEIQNSEFVRNSNSDDRIDKGGLLLNSSLLVIDELEETDIDNDCVDTELLDSTMADYAKMIDSNVDTSGQFGLDNGCVINIEATNQEKVVNLEKLKTVRVQDGSSECGKEAGTRVENKSVINSAELCNERIGERGQQETSTFSDHFAECSSMEKLKDGINVIKKIEEDKSSGEGLKKLITVESQTGNSEFVEVLGKEKELKQGASVDQLKHVNELSDKVKENGERTHRGSYAYSNPPVKYFEIKSLVDRNGGEDCEEGEISGEDVELADGDGELADEDVEMVHGNSKSEDKIKSECLSKNKSTCPSNPAFSDTKIGDMHSRRVENCNPVHVKTVGVTYGINLSSIENEERKPSVAKEANNLVKKASRPLTEGRKAKRKAAKKRKRAKQEREQGVKRLKLQPIVKPKAVKYCNYYLAGRCQQGDTCKFSHDTIPLTKSQPCSFFAKGTCMKSDDCPFDHQLSKYPCHNHVSKGMCPRGNSCKFSHKLQLQLPVTEDSSPASIGIKKEPSSSSGKPNLSKHLSMNINQSQSNAISNPQSIAHKPTAIIAPKIPAQIPDGLRFLSIGDKCNEQKEEKPVILSQSWRINMLKRMEVCETANNSEKPNADKRFGKASSTALVAVGNRTTPTEVTEASKILEEFLFCGTG